MLVDTFINAIFLYDDKVVITFNYREGGKTITLEDVTSSDMDLAGAPV
jgi:site-specific DNA recombinase